MSETERCGNRLANNVCREPYGHDGLHVSQNTDSSILRWGDGPRHTLALGPYKVGAAYDRDDDDEVLRITLPAPQEVASHLSQLINEERADVYITLFLAERLPDD